MRQKKNPSAFLPRTPPGSGRGEGHRGYPQDPTNASPSPCRSGFRTGGPSSAVTRGRCWPTGQRRSSSPTAKKPPSSSPWHRGPRRSAPSTSPGPAPPRTGGCRHRQGQGTGAGIIPTSGAAPCCCRGHGELCTGQRSQGQELTGVCSGNPHQPCLHILCPLQSSLHAFWGQGGPGPHEGPSWPRADPSHISAQGVERVPLVPSSPKARGRASWHILRGVPTCVQPHKNAGALTALVGDA